MHACAIGIDTGGTYTDAVIIDLAARRVLAKAKALTTRDDLAIGVAEALRSVLDASSDALRVAATVRYVALSTTLATNAIVEGHGAPIGVVLIGFDHAMAARTGIARALPGTPILCARGGHDHAGDAVAPLDEAAISEFLHATRASVAAYAVAGHYAVRNPAHELRARALIEAITGYPASLASELAHALDAPRRALTAALNARIIGRVLALIDAVRKALARHAIAAPLFVVKGDGTLASASQIGARPIETILSGPAASTVGARFLSGLADLVVADIGGTTTDIAVLEGGWPRLDHNGAVVGGHRTLVRAIDLHTFGLGGDSEVRLAPDGAVALLPGRVWPLALLGARWPGVITTMRAALANPEGEPHAGRFALRIAEPRGNSAREAEILGRIDTAPTPLGTFLRGPLARRALDRLVARGAVALGAFTPSDAAHVLRQQAQWSREAAVLGALLLRRASGMLGAGKPEAQAEAVARDVFDAVLAASGRALVASLADAPLDGAAPLVEAAVSGRGRLGRLGVALAPVWPVVAVGGPAPVFYPALGARLGCRVVLPEHAEVANAVGAAVAVSVARAVVEITGSGMGEWRVHHRAAPIPLADPTEALALARELAAEAAREGARAAGGGDGSVELHTERVDLPDAQGDGGLIAATVVAEFVAALG
jgi:N-methylhydantoinase A/oxoprolinase/acetone carboxylase beta subunit